MITSTPYVPYYQPCQGMGPFNPNRCAVAPAMVAPPVAMAVGYDIRHVTDQQVRPPWEVGAKNVGYNQRHATDMQPRPPWEVGRGTTGKLHPYWNRFFLWGIGAFCVVMLYQYLSKNGRQRTLSPWILAGVPAVVGFVAADMGNGKGEGE